MRPSEDIGDRWAAEFSVDPDEVEAEFDAEAPRYEQQLQDWDYRVPEDATNIFKQFVPFSDKVLEAGCGTGAQTVILAPQNPDCIFISVDIAANSLTANTYW